MVQAPQTGERLLACTPQQALALPCPVGTWSQTLAAGFAARTWSNGRKSSGRGLAKADTTPEGPVHVVHVSLRNLCKGRGAIPWWL